MFKNRKGITLIALIVSIIVLLILAGVTVATLTGDNGLITKAGEARNTNIESEGLERIQLAVMASRDDKGINTTLLAKNLSEISGLTDTNNQAITENTEILLPKNIKLNNIKYKIKKDGTVIINNSLLPDEYQQVEYIESSGTQWIDTSFYQKDNFILTCEAMFTSRISSDPNSLFSNESLDISLYSNGKMANNKPESPDITIGEWQTFRIGMNNSSPYKKFMACNDNIRNYESSWIANRPWCIFNHTIYKTYSAAAKLKEFTLTNFLEDVVLMRGVPALDKNNKPCIFDIVSKNVYYNTGTGTFGYETEDGTYVAPTNN